MHNTIPTVNDFFNQYGGYTREEMLSKTLEFTKLHVKSALEQARITTVNKWTAGESGILKVEDLELIYPLENIK